MGGGQGYDEADARQKEGAERRNRYWHFSGELISKVVEIEKS